MKVCLINPSSNFNYDFEAMKMKNKYSSGSYNYVHLGLAYIASFLEQNGYEVDVLECEKFGISIDDIKRIIEKNNYIAVGISTVYQNLKNVYKIARTIKRSNPNIFVYLGGYGATFSFEQILKQSKDIDMCMLGEGELTTFELIQMLVKKQEWRRIDGIAYLESGKVVVTQKRKVLNDLDVLPFPKRLYSHEAGVAQILSSRGCYGKCIYCGIQEFFSYNSGNCLRRRSADNVFNEMKELVSNHQVKHFVFCDPNFALNGEKNQKWVKRFCELLRNAEFKVRFDIDIRANEVVGNENLLIMLKEVGLETILIGVENFSQRELDFMKKSIESEKNTQALQIIQELGFKYVPGILLFNPTTTLNDIVINLNQIKLIDLKKNNTIVKPISAYGAIISSPGLTIKKFINNNGYYKNDEKGYKFASKDVELCYEMIRYWQKIMPPEILKYRTLDIAAEDLGLMNIKKHLKNIYSEIYEVDLNVFSTLVEAIKSKKFSQLSDATEYFHTYDDWLLCIKNKLNRIFNIIEMHWRNG